MPTNPLLPSEARKLWKSSTVASPMKVVRDVFRRAPSAQSRDLVERCVARGVLKATAKVSISKLKRERKQQETAE